MRSLNGEGADGVLTDLFDVPFVFLVLLFLSLSRLLCRLLSLSSARARSLLLSLCHSLALVLSYSLDPYIYMYILVYECTHVFIIFEFVCLCLRVVRICIIVIYTQVY